MARPAAAKRPTAPTKGVATAAASSVGEVVGAPSVLVASPSSSPSPPSWVLVEVMTVLWPPVEDDPGVWAPEEVGAVVVPVPAGVVLSGMSTVVETVAVAVPSFLCEYVVSSCA